MKRIMLIGKTGCGKTTLAQRMLGETIRYEKTQTVSLRGSYILDTPGEYLEQRGMYKALIVTAADADVILFLQDASDPTCSFSPGMAGLFPKPSIGIVTKCDLCPDPQQRAAAEKLLALAGVQVIFHIGLHEKDELEKLVHFLMQQEN